MQPERRTTHSIIVTMRKLIPVLAVSCAIAIFAPSLAAKDFIKPAAQPAKSYPAHDDHPDEKIAIAADPYDTADKAKIFTVDFHEHGFLPIFFVVTNDGGQPVALAGMEVKLITAGRAKLSPTVPEDIYRRISNPQDHTHPSPLPIPRKKVKGGITSKQMDEIESAQFAAKAVEPHTTQSGFLFFDVGDVTAPLAGAHLYVTGINDASGKELMYFELPLETSH